MSLPRSGLWIGPAYWLAAGFSADFLGAAAALAERMGILPTV